MISEITQYLIELSPAVAALVGIIVTIVVGFNKIKAANKETVDDVRVTNKEMREANLALMKENAELKDEIKSLVKEIKHIKEK